MTRTLEEIAHDLHTVCTPRDGLEEDYREVFHWACASHDIDALTWAVGIASVIRPNGDVYHANEVLRALVDLCESMEKLGTERAVDMCSITRELLYVNQRIIDLGRERMELQHGIH